jgi:GTPase SAR1 family protein
LYIDGDAAIIVYSCTSEDSLKEATMWCKEARDNLGDEAVLFVVENKVKLVYIKTIISSITHTDLILG